MSKYSSLKEYLKELPRGEWNAAFADVERILGRKLPKSAYEYPAWWANNPTGHSHSRAWVEAGWKTAGVDIANQRLTFQRMDIPSGSVFEVKEPVQAWGFMCGSVRVLNEHDLTQPIGEAWDADQSL